MRTFVLALVVSVSLCGCPNPGGDGDPIDEDGGTDAASGPTLSVTKDGTGMGTVVSSPAGIDCGDTCAAPFSQSTEVTLTAEADPGSVFTGWSGACNGTDDCVVALEEDTEVIATFDYASATTSGGLAVISTGDESYAFVPTSAGIVIVPLEGLDAELATVVLSFAADSCTADGVDLKVVCVSYWSSTIAILDLTGWLTGDDITFQEYDLEDIITSASFSGGSCINCGVLADSGDHRFILSSGDGYRVFDYTATLLKEYLSTEEIDLVTENFGYDNDENLIISPEYETSLNRLWIVDVDTDEVFVWVKTMMSTYYDAEKGLPELDAAGVYSLTGDAAAVDPSTGVLSIGHEWVPLLLLLNLNAVEFTSALEGESYGTFDAPYSVAALSNVYSPYSWPTTGMAIEPQNHLMFLEEEFGDSMGLVVLPDEAGTDAVTIDDYTSGKIPAPSETCPSLSYSWSNVGDPHGLALFTAVVDGRPMGLLISSDKTCAAVVDLEAFLSAPEETDMNYTASTYDLSVEGVIRFISLQ